MDLADFQALQELLGAFADCLTQEASPWERLQVAGDIMVFFQRRPVLEMPGLAETWEWATNVHNAAVVDLFRIRACTGNCHVLAHLHLSICLSSLTVSSATVVTVSHATVVPVSSVFSSRFLLSLPISASRSTLHAKPHHS